MIVVILEDNKYLDKTLKAVYKKTGEKLDTIEWYALRLIEDMMALDIQSYEEMKKKEEVVEVPQVEEPKRRGRKPSK